MSRFPAIFLSHGSPDLPLHHSPVGEFLQQLGKQIERPKAILCISAHWMSPQAVISTASHPKTHYDFNGFPAELYSLKYPAPGAPELAEKVVDLLTAAGIESSVNAHRGLDHGAWVPLMLMYPDADIPITQLSIQPNLGTAHHLLLGQALQPLCDEGVLVLASGSATHNLGELGGDLFNAIPPDWVNQFTDWLNDAVTAGKVDDLLNYRKLAPYAINNHPTEEHLLPLFVAMGAAKQAKGSLLHSSFTYGVLSMAAYEFT